MARLVSNLWVPCRGGLPCWGPRCLLGQRAFLLTRRYRGGLSDVFGVVSAFTFSGGRANGFVRMIADTIRLSVVGPTVGVWRACAVARCHADFINAALNCLVAA